MFLARFVGASCARRLRRPREQFIAQVQAATKHQLGNTLFDYLEHPESWMNKTQTIWNVDFLFSSTWFSPLVCTTCVYRGRWRKKWNECENFNQQSSPELFFFFSADSLTWKFIRDLFMKILFLFKASQYLFSYPIAEVVVCLEREVKSLLCTTQKAF